MILILLPTTLLLTIVTWLMKLTELFVTGDYIHFLGGGGVVVPSMAKKSIILFNPFLSRILKHRKST